MTNAELIDALTDMVRAQAQIIAMQRETLMLHGIDDVTADDWRNIELGCTNCIWRYSESVDRM